MKRLPAVFGALAVLAALAAGASSVVAADADPRIGTWKLNLAKSKSKYDPGPAPKSQTRKYEVFEGDGVKYTQETVNADGTKTTLGYSAHFDGKDYLFTGNPNADTISIKRIDANNIENVQKKAGKVVQTGTVAVSKDGKTITAIQKSAAGAPRRVNNVLVYDRQ